MLTRQCCFLALKLAVSSSLIAVLIYWLDWQQAIDILRQANPAWLVVTGVLVILVIIMDGLRLYWMVPVDNLGFTEHLRLSLQSAFVMQLGFGVVSGDAYRTAGYALRTGMVLKPAVHIIAARIAGFSSVAIVALAVSLWVLHLPDASTQELGKRIIKIVILCALIAVLIFTSVLFAAKKRIINIPDWGITAINALKTITPGIWTLSLAMVVTRGLGFGCVLYAIGQTVPLHVPLLASITATLTTLLPIALGGLGIREGALAGTVTLFSIPYASALSAAILMRIVTIIATGLGLLYSVSIPADSSS